MDSSKETIFNYFYSFLFLGKRQVSDTFLEIRIRSMASFDKLLSMFVQTLNFIRRNLKCRNSSTIL